MPSKELEYNRKFSKVSKFPNCVGISPVSWLWSTFKLINRKQDPSSDGKDPFNALLFNRNSLISSKYPSMEGMDPVNLLLSK